MRFNKIWIIIALFFVQLLSGCKVLKEAGLGKKEDTLDSPAGLIRALDQKKFAPEWFAAKARVSFEDEDMSITGSATIRMKKDSLLWVSVKKLGFEVARALITTDSVLIIDRINNEYGRFDLDYLESSFNLPASFPIVQNVILGNPHFLRPEEAVIVETRPNLQIRDRLPEQWVDYYLEPKDLRLLQMDYTETMGDQSLVASFEAYDQLPDKQEFSFFRNFSLTSSATGATEMTIKFSQVELDIPQSIPFSIPRRYTRMDE
jgi:hypothetical protein